MHMPKYILTVPLALFVPLSSHAGDVIRFEAKSSCRAIFANSGVDSKTYQRQAGVSASVRTKSLGATNESATIIQISIPPEMKRLNTIQVEGLSQTHSGAGSLSHQIIQGRNNVLSTDQAAKTAPVDETLRYAPTRTKTVRVDPSKIMIVTSASESRAEDFNRLYPLKNLMPQGAVEFDMSDVQRAFGGHPINYMSAGINEFSLNPSNTLAPREAPPLKFKSRLIVDSLPINSIQQIANANSNFIRILRQTLEMKERGDADLQDFNVAYVDPGFPRGARLEISGVYGATYSASSRFTLAEYNQSPQRASEITAKNGRIDLVTDFVGLSSRRPLGEALKFMYEALNDKGYAVLFIPTEVKIPETGETVEFVKFFSNAKAGVESTPFSFFNRIPGFKLKNLFKRDGIKFGSTDIGASQVRISGPGEFNGIVVYLQKDSELGNPGKHNLGINEANSNGMRFLSIEQRLQLVED